MGRVSDTSNYTQEELELWGKINALQGALLHTAKGLPFRIEIKGNELFVDRRKNLSHERV